MKKVILSVIAAIAAIAGIVLVLFKKRTGEE